MAVNSLEQVDQYPIDTKLKSLGKTIYLINSDYHATDTSGFVKDKIGFCLFNIGPTGHYPMIEKPNEFNLLLEKAIQKIGAGK